MTLNCPKFCRFWDQCFDSYRFIWSLLTAANPNLDGCNYFPPKNIGQIFKLKLKFYALDPVNGNFLKAFNSYFGLSGERGNRKNSFLSLGQNMTQTYLLIAIVPQESPAALDEIKMLSFGKRNFRSKLKLPNAVSLLGLNSWNNGVVFFRYPSLGIHASRLLLARVLFIHLSVQI